MIIELSFANSTFYKAQKLNAWSAKHLGKVNIVHEKTEKDISEQFWNANKAIMSEKRGAGLWLWKPYLILNELETAKDGDYVFYCDSGAFFCRDVRHLIENMGEQDIWVSELPLPEYEWTKPSVFSNLNLNTPKIFESCQIQASYIIVRKSAWSYNFISEWLKLCQNESLISPLQPGEEKERCIAHREDQSLLSILCKEKGVVPHKDPSQYGKIPEFYSQFSNNLCIHNYPLDKYRVCIISHKTGEARFRDVLYNTLIGIFPQGIARMLYKIRVFYETKVSRKAKGING